MSIKTTKNVESIGTIANIEFYQCVNNDFSEVTTVASITFSDSDGHHKVENVKSIDFDAGLVETESGVYKIDNEAALQKIADKLNIEVNDQYESIPIIDTQEVGTRIRITDDTLTMTDAEGNRTYFTIKNMFYSIDEDVERTLLSDTITKKLSDTTDQKERNDIELLQEEVSQMGESPTRFTVGAKMSLVLEDDDGNRYMAQFDHLDYVELQKLAGFKQPQSEFGSEEEELISKLQEMQSEIVATNASQIHRFDSQELEAKTIENFQIYRGQIVCEIDGAQKKIDFNDIEATLSKRGIEIQYEGESYLVTSLDSRYQTERTTPNNIFNAICKAKEVERLSSITLDENPRSKVVEAVDSLSITVQYSWKDGDKVPSESYSIAGQRLSQADIEASVYASEANQILALRMGDETKILYSKQHDLSETTGISQISIADDKVLLNTPNGSTLEVDFLDTTKGLAICQGQIFRCDKTQAEIIGGEINDIQYINQDTNELASVLKNNLTTSNSVVNNWDIISRDGEYHIVSVSGTQAEPKIEVINTLDSLELDPKKGLLIANFQDDTFITLGKPSEIATAESIYKMDGKVTSMADAINQSNEGISTVIRQINTAAANTEVNQEIQNPMELIRDVPNKCFVVLEVDGPDGTRVDQLFFKSGNELYSHTDKVLSFSENLANVKEAFTTDNATTIALLEESTKQAVLLTNAADNGRLEFTSGDKEIDVSGFSYERKFPNGGLVAREELEERDNEMDAAINEM